MTPAQLLLMFNYRDSVARAADICGGPKDLAARVNASAQEVVLWSLGLKEPYPTQILRILELIHANDIAEARLAHASRSILTG